MASLSIDTTDPRLRVLCRLHPEKSTTPIGPVRTSRRAISTSQKQELRKWYFANDEKTRPTQAQVMAWFQAKYGRPINQSSVSYILSKKGESYDQMKGTQLEFRRHRKANYPDLEKALYDWQENANRRGIIVTGDILQTMAGVIFSRLPQYQGQSVPLFGESWLSKFKKRHNIYRRVRHGEAKGIDDA